MVDIVLRGVKSGRIPRSEILVPFRIDEGTAGDR
jgi:hypothetical protein